MHLVLASLAAQANQGSPDATAAKFFAPAGANRRCPAYE